MFLNCLKKALTALIVLLAMSATAMADDITLTAVGQRCNPVLHEWEFGVENFQYNGLIEYTVTPEDTKVTMTSNNPAVAEIGYVGSGLGNVLMKGFGSTTVTVSAGSQSVEIPVTVTDADAPGQADTRPVKDFVMPAKDPNAGSPHMEMIENRHNYDAKKYIPLPQSFLVSSGKGFMRVSAEQVASSKAVHVEYFDPEYNLIAKKDINQELNLFGGFYNGKDSFFLVFGELNPYDSPDKEVVRVVKYDKSWNRLSSASLTAEEAVIHQPFLYGSCSFAEYKNNLYVHTCRTMFKEVDGKNHQSCTEFRVNTDSMEARWDADGSPYVSHSFNQYILVDNRDIVVLDHGDAYPRALQLSLAGWKAEADSGIGIAEYDNQLLSFKGAIGQNITNAQVGGLEASSKNYLVAGSTEPNNCLETSQGGVFVTVTPKEKIIDKSANKIKFLSSDIDVNPYLVKFDPNKFLVVWGKTLPYQNANQQISYVFIDGDGNPLGSVQKMTGRLSDCQPVVSGNKAVWYSSNGTKLDFYSISEDGKTESVTSYNAKPVTPSKPANPDTPETPTTPDTPSNPGESDPGNTTPDTPSDPGTDNPGNTDQPSGPSNPSEPGNTGQPGSSDSPQQAESDKVSVIRLYNRISGEHLFTTDKYEARVLSQGDWRSEGTGWVAPSKSEVPVYRLYSDVTKEHLYTTDENEVNTLSASGVWTVDNNRQPLFYSGGSRPIYRLYHEHAQKHLLTADQNEYNVLPETLWTQEGVALYAVE